MTNQALIISEPFAPIVQPLAAAETVIVPSTPAGWIKSIESIMIANISAVARTFTIWLKETGTAGADANAICVDISINANTLYQLPIGPLFLPDGWEIAGESDLADSVNVTVSGGYMVQVPQMLRTV